MKEKVRRQTFFPSASFLEPPKLSWSLQKALQRGKILLSTGQLLKIGGNFKFGLRQNMEKKCNKSGEE